MITEKNNRVNRDEQARLPPPAEATTQVPTSPVSSSHFVQLQVKDKEIINLFISGHLYQVGGHLLNNIHISK